MTSVSAANLAKLQTSKLEIIECRGPQDLVLRLQELGFHQGLQFDYIGQAPLGGPLLFRLSTTVVALRPEEAACLLIRPV